jgi:hypothetical protein
MMMAPGWRCIGFERAFERASNGLRTGFKLAKILTTVARNRIALFAAFDE